VAVEERRRVAILFADLVGSTALGDRVDTETAYRVVSGCLAGLGRVVESTGGYVAKTLGDGLMALFGAPTAHGDDPERAARAGLQMQAWMEEYAASVESRHGVGLRLRVGINYGSVVAAPIAAGGRPAYDVLGDAVNVAQRVESAAEPGTVVVSEPFYRITRGAFEYRDLGAARLKGKREPLTLFWLFAERPSAPAATALPLRGREPELAELREAAARLRAGEGGLLELLGAPGMGKTRLLEELAQELVTAGIPALRAIATEAGREAPLSLWRGWLFRLLPVDPEMNHGEAAAQIRAAMTRPDHADWSDWLAALAVEPQRLLGLDAEPRQRITRGALRTLLHHWCEERPAALLVDQAELLDTLSMQLLHEAVNVPGSPLLVALARNETRDFALPAARHIRLEPLPPATAAAMLVEALPELGDSPEFTRSLVAQAGGSPLFLELMVLAARDGIPAGAVDGALPPVPDTLYGLVQAELDSLPPPDRRWLQSAAVLGKSFSERWLYAVCAEPLRGGGGPPPWHGLEARAVLVEQRPAPQRELAFRHGALQEVVYEGLLQSQRQPEHARAASAIAAEAAHWPELASRVAWHWREAGEWEPALDWTLRAAEYAASLYAGKEALDLYHQARDLADRLGRREEAARAVAGLAALAAHRGEFPVAVERYEAAEALLAADETAERELDAAGCAMFASLRRGRARVQALTGSPAAAEPLLAKGLQLLAPREGDALVELERVRCLSEHAHVLADLARYDAAATAAATALERSRAGGWEAEVAAAGAALGRVRQLQGDWAGAEPQLRAAAALADACGDGQNAAACWMNLANGLQASGRFQEAAVAFQQALERAGRIGDVAKAAAIRADLGVLYLNRGDWGAAEGAFRSALAEFQEMGHPLGSATSLANLADILRMVGRLAEAEAALAEAEAIAPLVETPYLANYLAIARAELALAQENPASAAAGARAALAQAQSLAHETAICSSRLVLGKALRGLGEPSAAAQELSAAAAGFAEAGERLDAARAQGEWAAALAELGDAAQARELGRKAAQTLLELDARPWLSQLPRLEPGD
jgi:class 3 adenylate cyclase/tetratricopeptide (TPR) repeat protein